MIYELLITSVKRALQAGRSGFAPVMRTRGIHPDLQSRLEALSGYRHDFTQGDPRNSVLLSHSVIESTAGKFSVLSRIVDAGSDHSGRSNKLAHHLAFDGTELRSATGSSPAATLIAIERSGIFATQWDSEPNEKNPGQSVDFPPTEPTQCKTWARYAGDAGWAGVLIDRAIRGQPTWIICSRGTAMLPLFAEAMALVEPARRWGISFTTHAITTTGFLWMVAVDGSPEAQNAQAQNRLLVIDITKPCKTPDAGPYAQAARGLADVPWKSRTIPAESQAVNTPIAGVVQAHGQPTAWPANIKTDSNRSAPLLRTAPPGLVVPPTIGSAARIQNPEQELRFLVTRRPRKALAILAAVSFLVLLLGTGLLVYQQYPIIKERVVAFLDNTDNNNTDDNNTEKTDTEKTDTEKTDTEKTDTEKTDTEKTDTEKTDTEKTNTEKTDTEKTNTEKTNTEKTNTEKTNTDETNVDNVQPILASLEILRPAGGQPARIRATFTPVQKMLTAKLQIAGLAPLPGKPENDSLIFDIPHELTPDNFKTLVTGTITLTNPSQTICHISSNIPPFGTTPDAFKQTIKGELAIKTVSGVTNVTPIDGKAVCNLLTLHPCVKDTDVGLVLLTPELVMKGKREQQLKTTLSLKQIVKGEKKWELTDEAFPLSSKPTFEIDNTDLWAPKLQFKLNGSALASDNLSYCKLAIRIGKDVIAVLQLLEPKSNHFFFENTDKRQLKMPPKPKDYPEYPKAAKTEYGDNGNQIVVTSNEKMLSFSFSDTQSQLDAGVKYECNINGGKLILVNNETEKPFIFKSDNLHKEDKILLGSHLLKIKQALDKPMEITNAMNVQEMKKGLETLCMRLKQEADEAAKDASLAQTDDKATKTKLSDDKRGAVIKANNQLSELVDLTKKISNHHDFIKILEKAQFDQSVSWDVEPSDVDKESVGTLTEEQKKVYAVVPEQKQSQ